jgi:hypothetical protein
MELKEMIKLNERYYLSQKNTLICRLILFDTIKCAKTSFDMLEHRFESTIFHFFIFNLMCVNFSLDYMSLI